MIVTRPRSDVTTIQFCTQSEPSMVVVTRPRSDVTTINGNPQYNGQQVVTRPRSDVTTINSFIYFFDWVLL